MNIWKDVPFHEILRAEGINCFPCWKGTKNPKVKEWKEFQSKKCELKIIDNYAVVCGLVSKNLFVIDLDSLSLYPKFSDFKTLTVKTGKGYHLYFFSDGRLPQTFHAENDMGEKLDLRSEGAYVIGPNSIHENGSLYEVVSETIDIMKINPLAIRDRLVQLGFDTKRMEKKRISEITKGVGEGERNDSALRFAVFCRGQGLDENATITYLKEWNKLNNPPLDERELLRTVESAMRYTNIEVKKTKIDDYIKERKMFGTSSFYNEIVSFAKREGIGIDSVMIKCIECDTHFTLDKGSSHKQHYVSIKN